MISEVFLQGSASGLALQVGYRCSMTVFVRSVVEPCEFDLPRSFHRLDFQDFRRLDIADYNHRHTLNLCPEDLEKAMYGHFRRAVCSGFFGYRMISLAVPIFWPVCAIPVLARSWQR